jgi:phage shock protein E
MGFFQKLFGGGNSDAQQAVANGATIIDVRSPQEFAGGHAKGAVNIPLNTLKSNITKIKKMKKPIVLCCASGMRSGQGTSILKSEGIDEVYNAGSWTTLK